MHIHGLYLHYPNLKRNRGFSTNHREPGLHTGGLDYSYDEKTQDIGLRVKRDRKYNIGLFYFDVMSKTAAKHFFQLHSTCVKHSNTTDCKDGLARLPIVNLHHHLVASRKDLQHYSEK